MHAMQPRQQSLPVVGDQVYAAPPPQRQSSEEFIDLRAHLHTLWFRKWWIASLVMICTALAVGVSMMLTPVYQATAILLLESERLKVVDIDDVYRVDASRHDYFVTQYELLRSRQLAEQAVEQLQLTHVPLTLAPSPSAIDQKTTKSEVIKAFMASTSIEPVAKSQLVQIHFESTDPALAAKAANTIGELFIESHIEAKLSMANQTTTWLNGQLEALKLAMQRSEEELQTYQQQNGLIDVSGILALGVERIESLNRQLQLASNQRAAAESYYQFIQEQSAGDLTTLSGLSNLPEVQNNTLIQSIKREQVVASQKVSELAKRYGARHPTMIAAQAELNSIVDSLRQQEQQVVAGIEREYRTSLANELMLTVELEKAKREMQQIQQKEGRYLQLKRKVETDRQLYATFLTRVGETSTAGNFEAAPARFTDQAGMPVNPAKPRKKLIVAVTFVASLSLGIVIALIIEAMKQTFSRLEDVEHQLSINALGQIPKLDLKGQDHVPLDSYRNEQFPSFSEAFRSIRTGYILGNQNKTARTLAITSPEANAGKTTIAENLAMSLGQIERVLLIDADLRRPSLNKHFDIPDNQPGLAEAITGTQMMRKCIHKFRKLNVDVMPSGTLPADPLKLLSSQEFANLLIELSLHYDRIVIDTPPLQGITDALIIADQVDSLIYVVRANHTQSKDAKRALSRLRIISNRIDGVILNQANVRKTDYYGYRSPGEIPAPGAEMPRLAGPATPPTA